jgi:hypothetical protein
MEDDQHDYVVIESPQQSLQKLITSPLYWYATKTCQENRNHNSGRPNVLSESRLAETRL